MKSLRMLLLFCATAALASAAAADAIPEPELEREAASVVSPPARTSSYSVTLGQPLSEILWRAVKFDSEDSLPSQLVMRTYRYGTEAIICTSRKTTHSCSCELTFYWARGRSAKDMVTSVVVNKSKPAR